MKKIILHLLIIILGGATVMAQAPQKFNYQGIARTSSGAPLASTAIGLRLTIHDGTATGTTVYQETFTPTTSAYGLYNVAAGTGTVTSGTFASITWSTGNKYMQVEIDPAGGTSYTSLGSTELLSVPYAMYAANSGGAAGTVTSVAAGTGLSGGTIITSGTISMPNVGTAGTYGSATQVPVLTTDAQGRVSGVTNTGITGLINSGTINYVPKFTSATALGNSMLFDNGSQVGLNTATPSSMTKMEISGVGVYGSLPYYQAGLAIDGTSTANASGVYAEGGWRGVYGRNPGTYAGTEAIGVLGRVEGSTYTGTGFGVKGENAGTGGTANYGVYGTASGTGIGVGGFSTGTGAGGRFDGGVSGAGIIVTGGAPSGFYTTTPTNMAKVEISGVGTYSVTPYYQAGLVVDGTTTASASGIYSEGGWRGVYGRNPGTAAGNQAIGVHGRCEGGSYTVGGYGILAEAVGTGPTNYGIYAAASGASGTNWAGYFSGNVHITGSISKGSGTFMIDHPLDPENKYLYHSFVESPDMMNIYNGNIVTDANGDATITMPDYFEALNKDFRYQLTTIGQPSQVYVSKEISANRFEVKSDKPNVKVSWQVTGVRHDKYADAHRVVPEVDKESQFKGHYMHAAEWGVSADKSFDAVTNPQQTDNTPKKQ